MKPPQSSLRMESDTAFVEVDPALGRVMAFGHRGGSNALWSNPGGYDVGGWNNFGGEKVWLWPQESWSALTGRDWPPPLEGQAWKGHGGTNRAEWEIPLLPHASGFIHRRADLDGNVLRIHSEIVDAEQKFFFRPWSITQIPRPDTLWIPTDSPRITPDPGPVFVRQSGGWSLDRVPSEGGKWFFDGDTIVASTPAGLLTIQNHGIRPPGSADPIEMVQVYFDKDAAELRPHALPPYAELEFVAPLGAKSLDLTFTLAD